MEKDASKGAQSPITQATAVESKPLTNRFLLELAVRKNDITDKRPDIFDAFNSWSKNP
jgi:hypothetical protein